MDRVDELICDDCKYCMAASFACPIGCKLSFACPIGCNIYKVRRAKFFELVRSFLPERKPVMSGEPCEWNDCLDEIEKNIKKRR